MVTFLTVVLYEIFLKRNRLSELTQVWKFWIYYCDIYIIFISFLKYEVEWAFSEKLKKIVNDIKYQWKIPGGRVKLVRISRGGYSKIWEKKRGFLRGGGHDIIDWKSRGVKVTVLFLVKPMMEAVSFVCCFLPVSTLFT